MMGFDRLIAPLKRRVMLMIGRAILHATIDDDGRQKVKLTALVDEVLDEVESFQNYGLASRPMSGAEAIIASVMGERARAVVLATEDRKARPRDLAPGEVIVYTDEDRTSGGKHRLHFKRGRKVNLKCSELVIEAGAVTMTLNNEGVLVRTPKWDWEDT